MHPRFLCKRQKKLLWQSRQKIPARTRIPVRHHPPRLPPHHHPRLIAVPQAAHIHPAPEAIPAGAHILLLLDGSDPHGAEGDTQVLLEALAPEVTVRDLILEVVNEVPAANEKSVAHDLSRHRKRL